MFIVLCTLESIISHSLAPNSNVFFARCRCIVGVGRHNGGQLPAPGGHRVPLRGGLCLRLSQYFGVSTHTL